jgi:hypothetical protein
MAEKVVDERSGSIGLEDTYMLRGFLILVAFLVSHAVYAASLKPQIPPNERTVYSDMLKTKPAAAKEYLATREYLSMCRQVVANPQLAINLVPEPDNYRPDYVTSAEQKVVDQAINLNIAAMLSRRH